MMKKKWGSAVYEPKRLLEPNPALSTAKRVGLVLVAVAVMLGAITAYGAVNKGNAATAAMPPPVARVAQNRLTVSRLSHIKTEVETEPTPTPEPTPMPTPAPVHYPLTAEERKDVELTVMAEAGGEDFDGKALVAQCILNTAEALGVSPSAVVHAKGQYAPPAESASDEVKEAVAAVFDNGYTATDECVRYFYAPARCTSEWHENCLEFVLEHGGHRFFKTKEG